MFHHTFPVEPVVHVPSTQTPIHQQNESVAANENSPFPPAAFWVWLNQSEKAC